MWTLVIILPEVRAAHDARLGNRMERIQIQTFIAHGPVKALSMPVLPGASRIDVECHHLMLR